MSENAKQPLVSVLMAIYNCADTLDEAVQSIINQTYTNWELILCDDASSDNTYEKALELAKKDSRIRVLKNERNLTLAPTLNKCIENANGVYTARMDGDDICDPTRFQRQIDFLENHPEFAVVSCLMEMYDEEGVYGIANFVEYPEKIDFAETTQICHAACMMRKNVLDELGGYDVSPRTERIEDYDLWIRMYDAGYKGYNIQETLYSMRDDRNALKRKKFKFRLTEYRLRRDMCKKFNLPLKCRLKAFKPLLLGLIPSFIYARLHRMAHKI